MNKRVPALNLKYIIGDYDNMLALTTVSQAAYKSLLNDGEMEIGEIATKYGAGFPMRIQGILCAMAAHQCHEETKGIMPIVTAEDLYSLISYYGYDEIFEENDLAQFKPKGALLESMMYSMCQAEMNDYE